MEVNSVLFLRFELGFKLCCLKFFSVFGSEVILALLKLLFGIEKSTFERST